MNTEKINPLEQHVEKIVLAVAAAGALYLGYLAVQPITVNHSGRDVAAGEIEELLDQQLTEMERTKDENERATPVVKLENFVSRYENLVKNQPLDPRLFAAVPAFGPANARIGHEEVGKVDENYALRTYTPQPPELVSAEVHQQPIAANVPPGEPVQPPAEGATLATRDVNAVVVQGYIPVAKMRAEMAAVRDPKERLPNEGELNLRHVVVYRVEVRRQERVGAGWSDWKPVEPLKVTLPPTDIDWASIPPGDGQARRLDDIAREAKQILMPDFYYDAKGQPILPGIVSKPPATLAQRTKALQDEEARANGTTPAPTPGAPGVRRPIPGQAVDALGNVDAGMAEEVAPAANSLTPEALDTKTQAMVPFAFWDENVEPGREYRYQVRIRYVNPVFGWRFGLKNKDMAKVPTLDSDWVNVPNPVTVNADLAFYAMSSGRGSSTASFRIFKRTSGRWYQTSADVPVGASVVGAVRVPTPDRPTPSTVDVDTGFRVVDITSSPAERVVLINEAGRMVIREPGADRDDPNFRKLMEEATRNIAPPTPAAGQQPNPDVDPLNPTAPGRGRGQPTPPPARDPRDPRR